MVFWTTGEGINTSNHEDEYYTARPENVRVENGHLVLEARHEDYMGEHYTSGILRSNAQWTYGRFEMCARLPQGRGTWPAFWMLPIAQNYGTKYWPDNGEIDIMELVGFKPYEIFGSTHTLVTNETGHAFAGTANTKFHLYAAEWAPDHVDYYVDHDFYFRVSRFGADWHSWPFDKDFYLLLNLAIGGDWGGAQGVDDSIFPVQYVIDFIRVFAP